MTPKITLIFVKIFISSLLESITNCIAYHKDIWRCFQYCPGPDPEPINQIPIPNEPGEVGQYPTRDAYPSPVEITAPMRELSKSCFNFFDTCGK